MSTLPGDSSLRGLRLLLDGGKSKTDAVVIDARGERMASARGPGLEIIAAPRGRELVHASLRETVAGLGMPRTVLEDGAFHTVSFGLNGVQAPSESADVAIDIIRSIVAAERYVVASDAVMTFLGAHGAEPGVVIAAGTGAVALALAAHGEFYRTDAYGPSLGDRGSGHDIGRRGLDHALRVADGMAGSAAIHERMTARFGDADGTMAAVYQSDNPSQVIASFSRDVAAAARDGDPHAAALWREAGEELARSVVAAAVQAGLLGARFAVTRAGGLFDAGELIRLPFDIEIARLAPEAVIRPSRGTALDGALVLAMSTTAMLPSVTTWS